MIPFLAHKRHALANNSFHLFQQEQRRKQLSVFKEHAAYQGSGQTGYRLYQPLPIGSKQPDTFVSTLLAICHLLLFHKYFICLHHWAGGGLGLFSTWDGDKGGQESEISAIYGNVCILLCSGQYGKYSVAPATTNFRLPFWPQIKCLFSGA